jgi:nitrite reductase/ring-hydroxylating ferredoxin subunit
VLADRGWQRLCTLSALPDGDACGFDPLETGHDTLLIVRRGRSLYGWRDDCPHQPGTRLPWKKNAYLNGTRERIVCSAHGALFEIETGLCTLGPCLGEHLQAVRVRLAADDGVEVELVSWRHPVR